MAFHGIGSMKKDEKYSEHEATLRFMTALRAAVNTAPKPLKDKPRQRPKRTPKKK
jgi:hypothetical protein